MKKVAVTGGIGCGKSYICEVFETLGVPVFYADEEAKKIYQDQCFLEVLKHHFGTSIFKEGALDRPSLAEIVFQDVKSLNKLNSLIHPKVIENFQMWASGQNTPYVIQEAALIFEAHLEDLFDYVVCVDAPGEQALKRVMRRDTTDERSVRQRMANQMSVKEKREKSDFVIVNDGRCMLLPQILSLHEFLVNR